MFTHSMVKYSNTVESLWLKLPGTGKISFRKGSSGQLELLHTIPAKYIPASVNLPCDCQKLLKK